MSLLGIDVGTTGCKAGVFSQDGRCLAAAYREYGPEAHNGAHELAVEPVWQCVRGVIGETAPAAGEPVTAVSAGSMGEATVSLDGAGRHFGVSILSSDPRGAETVRRLRRDFEAEDFFRINPNILGTGYTLPKLLWQREHDSRNWRRTARLMLWADFVLYRLGAEPFASNSLANRTLLFDMQSGDWSDKLLEWAGLPRRLLPPVRPGGTVVGRADSAEARELGLPADALLVAGGHDQCCNSLGAGAAREGAAVCGIGTYECITPCYSRIPAARGMLRYGLNVEHHILPGLYVSFLFNPGGVLLRWFRDTFAAELAGREDAYTRLDAEMPAEPSRLLVLPLFQPGGPPDFVSDAAGAIVGLKTSTGRGEIMKAIMECETLYFLAGMKALREMGVNTSEFVATGGGARSDAWLQIKADIFGVPFVRPAITEAGLLGAALRAGLSSGVFDDPDRACDLFVRRERVFEPDSARHAVYREKAARYNRLLPALHPLLRDMPQSSSS